MRTRRGPPSHSTEEAAGKYAAADYARKEIDEDFVVIARTDARGAVGGGLDDAINRANAYLEAGADVAFVEGPKDVDEVRRVCKEVNGPIMYNQTGISPRFSEEEMNELEAIAMTILPGATMRMQLMAVYDLAMGLKETGPLAEAEFTKKLSNHPLGDFHTFAGFDQGHGLGTALHGRGRAGKIRRYARPSAESCGIAVLLLHHVRSGGRRPRHLAPS